MSTHTAEHALKSNPVPTRFSSEESTFLQAASVDTGLTVSELVRRSVRLMRRQKSIHNSYHFVIELAA